MSLHLVPNDCCRWQGALSPQCYSSLQERDMLSFTESCVRIHMHTYLHTDLLLQSAEMLPFSCTKAEILQKDVNCPSAKWRFNVIFWLWVFRVPWCMENFFCELSTEQVSKIPSECTNQIMLQLHSGATNISGGCHRIIKIAIGYDQVEASICF